MKLQQIKIDFHPEQDRLLLRLASEDRSEILLWLTRRCVRLLWPLLMKTAESAPGIALQPMPDARQALLGMQHERALSQADFSRPYQNGERARPLGAEPVLVTRIDSARNAAGKYVLAFLPREGQGINLALDDTLLHGLCKLLQDAVGKADWDMRLEVPTGSLAGDAERGSRLLN